MAAWLPKRRLGGKCKVYIYPSCFDYVCRSANWEEIREEWGSSEDWERLATQMGEGESLDCVASRILNVADYNSQQLFAMWKTWMKANVGLYGYGARQKQPRILSVSCYREKQQRERFIDNVIMTIFSLPSRCPLAWSVKSF